MGCLQSLSQPPVRQQTAGNLASFLRIGNMVFLHYDSKTALASGSNKICETPEGFRPVWSVYTPTSTGPSNCDVRLYVSKSVVSANTFEGKPYTSQLYLANPGGEGGGCLYFRSRYGGAWNAWRKVTHSTV